MLFETEHDTVRVLPTSSIVMSDVGANAGKSKVKLPPGASSARDSGATVFRPRFTTTEVMTFFDPDTGVTPMVTLARCAAE